jgi:hypothetical protein
LTDLPVRKVSTVLQMSEETLRWHQEQTQWIDDVMQSMTRSLFRMAWEKPDNPFGGYRPDITPRLTATIEGARRVRDGAREARTRVVGAVEVLRYGVTECGEDW